MSILNQGRTKIVTKISELFINGGVGVNSTQQSNTDTGLVGGGTTIDSCDATTGWTASGVGSSVSLNTTADEFKQGTGSINLITSGAGTATYTKTISSTDFTDKVFALWFYINDVNDLTTSTNGIVVTLTDSSSNEATYDFDSTTLSNGWRGLQFVANNPSAEDVGFDISDITSIAISVVVAGSISSPNMRMDYWRYYSPGTRGITDSFKALVQETGSYYLKTVHTVLPSESNGLILYESSDSDASEALTRNVFTGITKGENTTLQVDKYYYIDEE